MFKGKTALITGGANGIGRALVKGFIAHSAKVAFIDRDEAAGNKLAKEIEKEGGDILFYPGDIADPEQLKTFCEKSVEEFGEVSYLINNAMESKGGLLSDCSYEDFLTALKIGVAAPYELTRLLTPHFKEKAAIVNIASSRAMQSQADTESYSAAKGGITALTHSLMASLSGKVRVNAISPGWIDVGETYDENYEPDHSEADTTQHPSGRVGRPQDIVRATLFLCDEKNDFINGEVLSVDGGMSKRMIYSGDEGWTFDPDTLK